jgi:alpha-L-arabinofuranosidase
MRKSAGIFTVIFRNIWDAVSTAVIGQPGGCFADEYHWKTGMAFVEHRILRNDDLDAVNSINGEKVKPAIQQGGVIENKGGSSKVTAVIPSASWNVIRLAKKL